MKRHVATWLLLVVGFGDAFADDHDFEDFARRTESPRQLQRNQLDELLNHVVRGIARASAFETMPR
jgi:hypothetical protein